MIKKIIATTVVFIISRPVHSGVALVTSLLLLVFLL